MERRTIEVLAVSMLMLLLAGCRGSGGASAVETADISASSVSIPGDNSEVYIDGYSDAAPFENSTETTTTAPIPEPATLALLGIGTGLVVARKLRKKA
jgi:hypothetical protein